MDDTRASPHGYPQPHQSFRPGAAVKSPGVVSAQKACFNKLKFNFCDKGSNCQFSHNEDFLAKENLAQTRAFYANPANKGKRLMAISDAQEGDDGESTHEGVDSPGY
jgi:hypothetical protein